MSRAFKFLFKTVVVLVLLFLVFIGILSFAGGSGEFGLVGLIAAGGLYMMWDHRKGKKQQ